jgi:Ca2+-binding RTX toxin-like protein
MDLNDVESIVAKAFGGTDNVVVDDLSGTDLADVQAELAAPGGGDDGAADTVVANATNGDDVVSVVGDLQVSGLAAQVTLAGAVAGSDRLIVNGLAGDDVLDASSLPANTAQLTLDGGDGDDVLLGGAGNDVLLGGAGDDVLLGGPGNDTLDGGPGDNVVIQGLGGDIVTKADAVGRDWLAAHARTVAGRTVLEVGGQRWTLPNASLAQLIRSAAAL